MLFWCSLNQTWISFIQVCDGKENCRKGEDENSCQISSAKMCTILSEFNSSLKDDICPRTHNILLKKISYDTCEVIEEFPSIYPSLPTENLQNLKHFCIYELNECGMISHDASGKHLKSCKYHKCNETHYKCPAFYCVPWPYVCDGIWQCPGGMEETNCRNRPCKNQFHCKNSSICLHTQSICDKQLDCPLYDDEVFCDTDFPECPLQCNCLLFFFKFVLGLSLVIKK